MSDQQKLRRVAVLTALADEVKTRLAEAKSDLGADVVRGTLYAFADPADPTSTPLGTFTMSKPRQGAPRIVDQELAISWLCEEFDGDIDGMVGAALTETGRMTVLAAVKSGKPVRGVEIPAPGIPTASFRQDSDAKAAVVELVRAGVIDLAEVLALGGGA